MRDVEQSRSAGGDAVKGAVMAQIGSDEGIDLGGRDFWQQRSTSPAANGDPPYDAPRIAGEPDPARGLRQRRADPMSEVCQGLWHGQPTAAPDPGDRAQGLDVNQPDGRRESVGDARPGDVGIRVDRVVRDPGADHAMDEATLGIIGRHPVHPVEEQRVMRNEQIHARLDRLGHRVVDDVDGEQHSADRRLGVAANQAGRVPIRSGRYRIPSGQGREDIAEGKWHGPRLPNARF